MEENILFWEALLVISFVPARNYLSKVSNLSIRITCESCLILRISMLTIFNIKDVSAVALVSLLLTVNIIQTLFCLLTLNRQKFALFKLKSQTLLLTNCVWTYIIITLQVNESVRTFCEGVCFRRWFWLKRFSSHSKWPAVWTYFLFTDSTRKKTN